MSERQRRYKGVLVSPTCWAVLNLHSGFTEVEARAHLTEWWGKISEKAEGWKYVGLLGIDINKRGVKKMMNEMKQAAEQATA